MNLSIAIFNNEAFRKMLLNSERLAPINKALFDALSVQFAILSKEEQNKLKTKKAEFKIRLKNLLSKDPIFFASVSSSTGDRNRVFKRHNEIEKLIQEIIEY